MYGLSRDCDVTVIRGGNRVSKEAKQQQSGPKGPGSGPLGLGMPVQKAKNFKGTLKRLITYLTPYKVQLLLVLITAS